MLVNGKEYNIAPGANLSCANLSGANLFCANLSGANLFCANLSGANLSDADLSYAIWRDDIRLKSCPIAIHGISYTVYILDAHMQIGCELHTFEQWAAFDNEAIAKMDGLHARHFWSRHRNGLLAMCEDRKNAHA